MNFELEDMGVAAERCFEALADERRRRVLAVLCEAEVPMSLTELAAELEREETDPGGAGAGCDRIERREVQLYHRHVPKLVDAGLVEFDRDHQTVTLASGFDEAAVSPELLAA